MNLQESKEAKILIIDDCRVSSLCIKQLLKNLAIENVDTANTYQKSIAMCVKKNYNILIVDYHLEQEINGLELFTLLKKEGFISRSCSLIILSGDSTTQTVMGVLSTGYGTYICKPVSPKIIGKNVCAAFRSYKLLENIYLALTNKEDKKAISMAMNFCIENRGNNEIELFIIQYLEKNNQQATLLRLCNHPKIKSRNNFMLADIKNSYRTGKTPTFSAIVELRKLIDENPLYVAAYDLLSDIYQQISDNKSSLEYALKALNITPSVSFRSIKLARLSALNQDVKSFCHSGTLLAKNMTISEGHWIGYVAEFLVHFEVLFNNLETSLERTKLVDFLPAFAEYCRRKLRYKQIIQFDLLLIIFECRLLILDGNVYESKDKLFKYFSEYERDPTELNSIVIIDLIALYYFFGESRLFFLFYNNLIVRKELNLYCQSSLCLYEENGVEIKRMTMLNDFLNKLKPEFIKSGGNLLLKEAYQKILKTYPYNTEACLAYLECNLKLSCESIPQLIVSLASVVDLKLVGELHDMQARVLSNVHHGKEIILQEKRVPTLNGTETLLTIEEKAEVLRRMLLNYPFVTIDS